MIGTTFGSLTAPSRCRFLSAHSGGYKHRQAAQIRPNVDLGSDGNDDAQGQGTVVGDTIFIQLDVNQEHWGKWTEFDVTGTAISLPFNSILSGSEFMERESPPHCRRTPDLGCELGNHSRGANQE